MDIRESIHNVWDVPKSSSSLIYKALVHKSMQNRCWFRYGGFGALSYVQSWVRARDFKVLCGVFWTIARNKYKNSRCQGDFKQYKVLF